MSFLWGSATSSYQVEGGNKNDWSKCGMDAGRASNHFDLFENDFNLAKILGHNAHRLSIEWSRIEPEEGKFNQDAINHYKKVISALRERDIEPFVTLWHWPIPVWLQEKGGWESDKIVDYFLAYIKKIVPEFKRDVRFWITLNEPEIYSAHSYLKGIWPPKKKNILSYLKVRKNLIKTHREAYKVIKNISSDFQVGIAKNNIYFEAYKNNPISLILKNIVEWWWNFNFLNSIKNYQDFIGLNYYFHNRIKSFRFNQNDNKEVSDLGWEIYPEGMYHVLKDLKKYDKPIYITENGIADAEDKKRADFIRDHVEWMKKAMNEGVDVRGYLYWSLIDNFEWDKGFGPRFGLVEINYETMERKVRPSAYEYKKIIEMNKNL